MSDNEPIKERLFAYLKLKGITPTRLENTIRAGGSYLKNVKSIGSDKLFDISTHLPDLNIDWLVTGRGEMLYSEATFGKNDILPITESQQRTIEALSKSIENLTQKIN